MSGNTDAFDIAAGTIAIIELARRIGLYIYSLVGRHDFLQDIAFQVAGVQVLLVHLRHFDLVREAEATWVPLQSVLERLEAKLKSLSTSSNPLIHAWPQHEEDISRLVRAIEGHKSNLFGHLHSLQLAISQSTTPKILRIAEEVHELVQESRKRGLREVAWRNTEPERAETLAWLTKLSFTSEQAELQRRWVPGTAVWLQQELQFLDWIASKRAEIMLILGHPGCGKTMLASQLVASFSDDKIAVFSRPSCEALAHFGDAATFKVQITPQSNRHDISKFAHHKLQKMVESNPILSDEQLRSKIVETLLSKADGMFLWVDLQADNLSTKPTVTHLRGALKQLVHGIDQVFERSLERIRGRPDEVRQIAVNRLQWARFAQRPLHIEEMREAVAIEEGLAHLSTDDMVPGAKLISYCADLVLLDQNDYVQMLHASLKQVLQGNWVENPLLKDLASPIAQYPERHLADCCLSYLLLDNFDLADEIITSQGIQDLIQAHPFLPYAAKFWAVHVRSVAGGAQLFKEKIIKLITDRRRMNLLLVGAELHDNPRSILSIVQDRNPLHFVAEHGLQELFAHFQEDMESMSVARDSMGLKPLDLALKSGYHAATLDMLKIEQQMKRWQTKQDSGLCRLHLAIEYGWQDVVDAMLTLRATLFDVDDRGMAPLHVASSGECGRGIFQTLLEAGADVEQVTTKDHNTSLMLAAEAGSLESVNLLLKHGASAHSSNKFGQTALHFACRNGKLATVKAIIEASDAPRSLVNTAEDEGETPLFEATWCGYAEVVECLLRYGASARHTNNAGQTVFHVAAGRVQKAIFIRLLQHDADFACRDAYGWDPLDIISLMHFDAVLQRLEATIPNGTPAASALTWLEKAWENRSPEEELREWLGANLEHDDVVTAAMNTRLRDTSQLRPVQRRHLGRDESSLSFLHAAAATNCCSVIERATQCPDIDLSCRDKWGRTPYDLAIGEHNSEARLLLRNAATDRQVQQEEDTYPELINLASQLYVLKPGCNLCCYVLCDVCGVPIDERHWLHCKVCNFPWGGWDVCETCLRDGRRSRPECDAGHSYEAGEMQLLYIANRMISGPTVRLEEILA